MQIVFQDTMTGTKRPFKPLNEKKVGLYTCGPTVYDYAHIGNFRAYIFEDLLRRVLEYFGYEVTQIMNITDIDDKTIRGAQEKGILLTEYTEPYIQAFYEDLESLRIQKPTQFPRATEHIPEMIEMIQSLIEKGHAYANEEGSVYFKIDSFGEYGKLSKKKLDQNIQGARIDSDEYDKDNLSDFALWKAVPEGDAAWKHPFGGTGFGRPGWHIECSAMSVKYLGEHFDIHTGGEDNIFPHHENEIAQSVCCSGNKFVNYWLHCRFLLVNGEKMSKSKGNFYTLRDLIDKGYDPVSIRYLLLSHHYRHPLNFTLEGLEQAKKAIRKINDFMKRLEEVSPAKELNEAFQSEIKKAKHATEEALANDLNISEALGHLFDLIHRFNHEADQGKVDAVSQELLRSFVQLVEKILDVKQEGEEEIPDEVLALVEKRTKAKKEKDFQTADACRDQIQSLGWMVMDTKDGLKIQKQI